MSVINNVHFDTANEFLNRKRGCTAQEAVVVQVKATLAIAYEARTQTLIELYKILEPGLERQNTLIAIMERTYE